MTERFGRILLALMFALTGAVVVAALTLNIEATIAAALAGVIAALVATGQPPAAPRPRTAERDRRRFERRLPEPAVGELLEAVAEPMMLAAELRVTAANAAARTLLGEHIVGQDVRLAIRHPAAAERLTSAAPAGAGATQLVGLGTRDQRWELRETRLASGHQFIHLINLTGSYAAERMRVDFVANASHELRTPLASIMGYIETLGEDAGEEPVLRARFLKIMMDEARRMQRLVEDLLSLSRIEADKYRLPDRMVDLATLLEEVCAELRGSGRERAADLVCATADELPLVAGDRAQLSQMFHNLITNAMKYGRPGTAVTVSLREAPGAIAISVADEGEGIAPAHLPRLTERFYRVDSGRSRALGGTGLGLAIVKHICERHRGRLDIASKVGVGTTVTVTLPASTGQGGTQP